MKCSLLILLWLSVSGLASAQTVVTASPSPQAIDSAIASVRDKSGDVTIYLRGGRYELTRPVVLTADDGRADRRLTIKALPGERPVVTSSVRLSLDWRPYRRGIWQAHLDGDLAMDMLLVDGSLRPMARYPNYDSTAIRFNGTSAEATAPARVKRWKHPDGGYLHAMHAHDWGDFHYRITGRDRQGRLRLEGGHQNNRPMGLHAENRMVEHIFEELDAPGEWYYDRTSQTLYYMPLPGEDIRQAAFESPQLKHLLELRGSADCPVRNITIEGLELTGTVRTFMEPYEPLLRSDWTVYRGGAIFLSGTEDCQVSRCHLHHLGGNAVFFSGYNRRDLLSGSHIEEVGASAVCFVGEADAVRSPAFTYDDYVPYALLSHEAGPQTGHYPAHCTVSDNLIHRIGLVEKQITGVELSMSQAITVSHNTIYDTPRAGINVSEGTWGGHIIEHNDVFDTVRETGDHGSFNSWGRDRYWHPDRSRMDSIVGADPGLVLLDAVHTTVIRHNRFRCDRGWDIDLDDGSSNYLIADNLCLNGGIKLREGFYRTVENNILINNTFHPHVWFAGSGDVFTRNIVMRPYRPIQILQWGLMVDYNIFADKASLAAARDNGTDAHSIVSPLDFRSPAAGDYSLPVTSDAVTKGGFHNFSMTDFGVASPELRRLARRPELPLPVVSAADEGAATIAWRGLTLKNLTTLAERSATGMDAEHGVYVVSDDANGPLRDYLRANDVILRIGDTPTDNLDQMTAAMQRLSGEGRVTFTLFRSQHEQRVDIPLALLRDN